MQENRMNFALMLTTNRDDAQDLMQDTTLIPTDSGFSSPESAYQVKEIRKAIVKRKEIHRKIKRERP